MDKIESFFQRTDDIVFLVLKYSLLAALGILFIFAVLPSAAIYLFHGDWRALGVAFLFTILLAVVATVWLKVVVPLFIAFRKWVRDDETKYRQKRRERIEQRTAQYEPVTWGEKIFGTLAGLFFIALAGVLIVNSWFSLSGGGVLVHYFDLPARIMTFALFLALGFLATVQTYAFITLPIKK